MALTPQVHLSRRGVNSNSDSITAVIPRTRRPRPSVELAVRRRSRTRSRKLGHVLKVVRRLVLCPVVRAASVLNRSWAPSSCRQVIWSSVSLDLHIPCWGMWLYFYVSYRESGADGSQDSSSRASSVDGRTVFVELVESQHRQGSVANQHAGGAKRTSKRVAASLRGTRIFWFVGSGIGRGRSVREDGGGGGVCSFVVRKHVD